MEGLKVVLGLFSYGGIEEATIDSVLGELGHASQNGHLAAYHRISGDALIERSRSRALGKFLDTDADVIVMIDHDIQWRPGDMWHIAEQAQKERALVGGLYCKRAMGRGWSSRVPLEGQVEFGKPGLIEAPALATGFLAIPRSVVEGIVDKLDITRPFWQQEFQKAVDAKDHELVARLQDLSIAPIADGAYRQIEFKYFDFFRCVRCPNGTTKDLYQFLSEDWSFSYRAIFCGYKSYLSTFPLLIHHGNYGYTIPDGMDDKDKEFALNGQNQNISPGGGPDTGARGDNPDVRNQCHPVRRNQPKRFGAGRQAGKRRRK